MKKFFDYLKVRPLAMASAIVLCVLYLVMIFSDFVAPYRPAATYENNTFHPANIQFTLNGIKVREFRVINRSTWTYARVKDEECIHSFKLFAKGYSYKILGVIPCSRHLFGSSSDYPAYIMGADNLGRDIFSRLVHGSRISLTIGFVATAVSLFLAIILGGISGYFGSAADWIIMRTAEFFMLFPSLYFILFLRSILNTKMDSGTSYMIITLILALVGWPGMARTLRGMIHSIKREEFVVDAALEGIPSIIVIVRHIIPQISSYLIVGVTLSIPGYIMSETALSYLGLGINDPAVSWGSMINRDISTLSNLRNFPWLLYPVVMLLLVTLAFNFFGDMLRDFFDPYSIIFRKKRRKGESLPLAGTASPATPSNGALPRNAPNVLLSVEDLHVTFSILRGVSQIPVYGVRGVSFYVNKGEILGLVGESGSGKSVTTTAIPGLLPANAELSGHIYFNGTDLTSLSKDELRKYRGSEIALIFQEPGRSFDPLQTIGSVFLETFRVKEPEITREDALKKAEKLLAEVGLPDPAKRLASYPHQFSGGQLQRIGIALALAQDCRLLIADEPTTALDVTIQAQIVSLLLKLKEERNLSIIFISHNISLVAQICDRICVMYGGKVMETGTSSQIMNEPRHPYTKALVSAMPEFGLHYSRGRMVSIPGKVTDPASPEPGCPFEPRCSMADESCREKNAVCKNFA